MVMVSGAVHAVVGAGATVTWFALVNTVIFALAGNGPPVTLLFTSLAANSALLVPAGVVRMPPVVHEALESTASACTRSSPCPQRTQWRVA